MHIVIAGNGIAGVTAARHIRKGAPGARVTLISDETLDPYARTALMYVHMGTLTRRHTWLYEPRFWATNRIARVLDRAEAVDPSRQRLALRDGGEVAYDGLLIATGSVPVVPPWPGADLPGVHALYGWADLDAVEQHGPRPARAVVVGGGLIGVEWAEMLRVRGAAVTFLVREAAYLPSVFTVEESGLVADEIRRHGVDLRFGETVEAVEGRGRVEAVVTARGERIETGIVAVGTGVQPNVGWLAGSGVEVDLGVLVDRALQTTVPGVFAAGDCAQLREPPDDVPPTRPIWYTARLQGAVAGLGLIGRPQPYRPGVFFNSAKFFDLEYQVYGEADPSAPGQADHVRADGRRSVRIRYRTDGSEAVVGVSALGVRLRQSVCTSWIADGVPLAEALRQLRRARFDPEFTKAIRGR